MAIVIRWNGPQLQRALKTATAKGIAMAGVFLQTQCKLAVNRPNTGQRRVRTRTTSRGRKGSSYTVYPNSSKPGEPPKVRTGHGRDNIVHEHDAQVPASRVGVRRNALYMIYHELGLRGARRPWLVATLMRVQGVLARLAAVGGKSAIK